MNHDEYETPLTVELYTRPESNIELGFPVTLFSLTDAKGKLIGAARQGQYITFELAVHEEPGQPRFWEFSVFGGLMSLKGLKHEDVFALTGDSPHELSPAVNCGGLARKPGDNLLATKLVQNPMFYKETP